MSSVRDYDFGWYQRPGQYGMRLTFNEDTGVLYVHTADPSLAPDLRNRIVGSMTLDEARKIGYSGEGWPIEGPAVLARAGLGRGA